ncbi:YifB family Mg chelatase-like AAA ATPase [Paenibacillus sp. TRM 82003]|nr:YifB family Mg chelatase-like AAA ATPase [Paenibacillus sp. TRM 82003]
MYGDCYGACMHGIDGRVVRVEVDLSNGLPHFAIVGLPDVAVRESTERVRAALKNGSYDFPMRRITVNLAPADVRKEGASFDLAIAVGILITSGQWPASDAEGTMFLGQLSLQGDVRAVPGTLAMAMAAREAGLRRIVVPWDNAREAALVEGLDVVPVRRLADVRAYASGAATPPPPGSIEPRAATGVSDPEEELDFADVIGQEHAKRALAIAAAGMHNVLLIGPPGSGKTMLMRRLAAILPPLEGDEALEATKIWSAVGAYGARDALLRRRPFRAPHHSITPQGLIGGGSPLRPGEVSLAHRGALFLDELPEFPRAALESLRQPMEDGSVTIARARETLTFPSRFLLAGTLNPCPCGFDGYEDTQRGCSCTPQKRMGYLSRLSGPLLDRIDMVMDVPRLSPEEAEASRRQPFGLAHESTAVKRTSTAELYADVLRARAAQKRRCLESGGPLYNAELTGKQLLKFCRTDAEASRMLMAAYRDLGLSARAHDRVLRVARTIADAEGSERIEAGHMNEALLYRAFERRMKEAREHEAVSAGISSRTASAKSPRSPAGTTAGLRTGRNDGKAGAGNAQARDPLYSGSDPSA